MLPIRVLPLKCGIQPRNLMVFLLALQQYLLYSFNLVIDCGLELPVQQVTKRDRILSYFIYRLRMRGAFLHWNLLFSPCIDSNLILLASLELPWSFCQFGWDGGWSLEKRWELRGAGTRLL